MNWGDERSVTHWIHQRVEWNEFGYIQSARIPKTCQIMGETGQKGRTDCVTQNNLSRSAQCPECRRHGNGKDLRTRRMQIGSNAIEQESKINAKEDKGAESKGISRVVLSELRLDKLLKRKWQLRMLRVVIVQEERRKSSGGISVGNLSSSDDKLKIARQVASTWNCSNRDNRSRIFI